MEFKLPTNLQTELLAYDPTLKVLAKKAKATNGKSTKPKYPHGNVNNLIPFDIVSQEDQQAAVDHINTVAAPDRHYRFTRIENQSIVTRAIIYHYESLWIAAWLPNKEDEYLYGFSYAVKDTQKTIDMLPNHYRDFVNEGQHVAYGRSWFKVNSRMLTKQDIISVDGCDTAFWSHMYCYRYSDKGKHISETIGLFQAQLWLRVPHWTDGSSIFERLKANSLYKLLVKKHTAYSYWENYQGDPNEWKPTVDSIFSIIDHHFAQGYYCGLFKDASRIRHILDKPFFRKWIQARCNEVIQNVNDESIKTKSTALAPWEQIQCLIEEMVRIHSVWPDCPIDYYQNNIDTLLRINTRISDYAYYGKAKDWLQQHMPVASYFNILNKEYKELIANEHIGNRGAMSHTLNLRIYSIFDWRDTVSMIQTILDAGNELKPPKRWRLNEFHDYVQGEAWKVRNKKYDLPQDLFPKPVRVTYEDRSWSFFQPSDTHQLASWGQAVRNCVGNAEHYANDVKKKKHFIVLCMLDGQPQFTVQLTVNNGMMAVKQIVGIANARLTEDQKAQYTNAFSKALQQRNDELASGS